MIEFDRIYTEICAERGLTSAVDMAIARSLALAVCEDVTDATKILALRQALPPAVEPKPAREPEKRPDLSRLTDEQLSTLDGLMAVACDEQRQPFEDHTPPRYDDAHRLVEFVETRLERFGDAMGKSLSEAEAIELWGRLESVLYPLTLLDHLAWWVCERSGTPGLQGYVRHALGEAAGGVSVAGESEEGRPQVQSSHAERPAPGHGDGERAPGVPGSRPARSNVVPMAPNAVVAREAHR